MIYVGILIGYLVGVLAQSLAQRGAEPCPECRKCPLLHGDEQPADQLTDGTH